MLEFGLKIFLPAIAVGVLLFFLFRLLPIKDTKKKKQLPITILTVIVSIQFIGMLIYPAPFVWIGFLYCFTALITMIYLNFKTKTKILIIIIFIAALIAYKILIFIYAYFEAAHMDTW